MADFIEKAKEEEPFNNGGSTLGKSGSTPIDGPQSPLSETDQNDTKSTIQANNNTAQSEHIDSNINGTLRNAAGLSTVKIDPLTGYPECPDAQFRVTWPTTFEWEALPPGSQNYSRMSACGCWLDLGVGIIDIIEGIFLIAGAAGAASALNTVYGFFRQGGKRLDDAVDGLIKVKRAAANWPGKWDDLAKSYRALAKQLRDQITNAQLYLIKAETYATGFKKAYERNKRSLDTNLADTRNVMLQKFLADPDQFPFHAQLIYDADAQGLNIFEIPQLETYWPGSSKAQYDKVKNAMENTFDDWQYWLGQIDQTKEKIKDLERKLDENAENIRNLPGLKQKEGDEITLLALNEAIENETTVGGMLANLGYACAYVGIAIELFTGSLYKKKICSGTNHIPNPNPKTCECECEDGYEHCLNDERTVANFLFGLVNVDTIEQATICSPPCCGGQAKYELSVTANPSCGCACLGDITFGTIISGGGSQDDYWKAGNGCSCLQHGLIFSTRGKCVSAFSEERATALGQTWDGDQCEFVCPQTGSPEGPNCTGNKRRKKITWTDSQGNTWPNQDSLCECECIEEPSADLIAEYDKMGRTWDPDLCEFPCPENSDRANGVEICPGYGRYLNNMTTSNPVVSSPDDPLYVEGCDCVCDGVKPQSTERWDPWLPICPEVGSSFNYKDTQVCACMECPSESCGWVVECTGCGDMNECVDDPNCSFHDIYFRSEEFESEEAANEWIATDGHIYCRSRWVELTDPPFGDINTCP